MALYSGYLSEFERMRRARKLATGEGMSYGETEGFTEGILGEQYKESQLAGERETTRRRLQLQEEAAKKEAGAARMSGVAQFGLGASNIYFASKYAGMNQQYLDLLKQRKPGGSLVDTGAAGGGTPITDTGASLSGQYTVEGAAPPAIDAAAPVGEQSLYSATGLTGGGIGTVSALGLTGAAVAGQLWSAPMVKKAIGHDFPLAAKGWQVAGLPGAATGATLDIGKHIISGVANLFHSIF